MTAKKRGEIATKLEKPTLEERITRKLQERVQEANRLADEYEAKLDPRQRQTRKG